jgi:O-methyltransferase
MSIRDACLGLRDAMVREAGYLCGRFILPRSLYGRVRNHTMCSIHRLDNMYRLTQEVEEKQLSGAIVECGVWKGGCAGVAATAVRDSGYRRRIHLFDSFEGLPEPGPVDGPDAARYSGGRAEGKLQTTGQCVATVSEVQELFAGRLGIDLAHVAFHVGWFQDTVPRDHGQIGPIALLRLDGDWYDSTAVCLQYLYPRVVSGGYVIMDDYGQWQGCRKAFEEYREAEKLDGLSLVRIDYTGIYFVKP